MNLAERARRVAGALACVLAAVSCDSDPVDPIDGSVESLDVVPASAWLNPGTTLQLDAIAKDSSGATSDAPVEWSSSDGRIVSVTQGGAANANAVGSAIITAEAGGVRTAITVTVTPAAQPVTWSVERQGLTDASLLGVWADDASPLAVVAGQAGVIMESNGGPWQLRQMPTEESFTGAW